MIAIGKGDKQSLRESGHLGLANGWASSWLVPEARAVDSKGSRAEGSRRQIRRQSPLVYANLPSAPFFTSVVPHARLGPLFVCIQISSKQYPLSSQQQRYFCNNK